MLSANARQHAAAAAYATSVGAGSVEVDWGHQACQGGSSSLDSASFGVVEPFVALAAGDVVGEMVAFVLQGTRYLLGVCLVAALIFSILQLLLGHF